MASSTKEVQNELPAWKKELILRKRANSRVHGDLSITSISYSDNTISSTSKYNSPTNTDSHSFIPDQRSARGHQLSSCVGRGPFNSAAFVSVEKIPDIQSHLECSKSSERVTSAVSDGDSEHDTVCTVNRKNNVDNKLSSNTNIEDMHHKGLNNRHCSRSTAKVLSNDCDQEEFQYGPGIVSRLKDRYLSLAMREAKSRNSLRKYSSLEDLLDDEPVHQRGRSSMKTKPNTGPQPSRKELMKRTRSVDSLSFRKEYEPNMSKSISSGGMKKAPIEITCPTNSLPHDISNNDIKIENVKKNTLCRNSSSSVLEEDDLPHHDTVRQTKQLFESNTSGSRVARGAASKVAAYKAAQPSNKPPKPAIKAKPPQLMARKAPLTPALENIRVPLKQVPLVGKPAPRSTISLRGSAGINENVSPLAKSFSSGLTPVTASVTAPLVNGDYKLKEKSANTNQILSSNNIRNDVPDFDITDRAISSFNSKGRPLSPVPANLPPSPPSSHKITTSNMLDCDSENLKEMERVMHENKKNMEKRLAVVKKKSNELLSNPSLKMIIPQTNEKIKNDAISPVPNVDPTVDANKFFIPNQVIGNIAEMSFSDSSSLSSSPSIKSKTKLREAQNNSVMFDFTKRNDTPNYIENDGLDMSKRNGLQYNENAGYVIMPGYEGRLDSSTDGEDLEDDPFEPKPGITPPPCNIHFEGEGVIINGRSNLQRQPKSGDQKLMISFDMIATSVYEYPSEASVLVEYEDKHDDISSPVLQGGLACYTPSKIQLADSFLLGVSKSIIMHPPTPPKERSPDDISIMNHLRPANESEIITWSSDNAPDLLF